MRKLLNLIFIILVSNILFAQNTLDQLPQIPSGYFNYLKKLKISLKNIQIINSTSVNDNSLQQDLIIGLVDPNEIVTISGNYILDGNLFIVNNGQLILDSANFQIKGDISILHSGRLEANGGSFTVIQEYIYEHEAIIWNTGELQFSNTNFSSSGQSWNITVADSANYILKDSEINDGFITTGIVGQGSGLITGTTKPGEFLCFENSNLEIRNCDLLLMWLVLPDSSVVDVSLPDDTLLTGWHFTENDTGVSGIAYTLLIDSCSNVNWGLISMTGSDGTFRNTKLRTCGLMFSNPDSIIVSNITNGSTHLDDMISVPDRNLRLVNSEVSTWNFYPSTHSIVTVKNSVFGELLALDSSSVQIENSVCDGSGGYLGVAGQSTLIVIRSLISSQVISRQSGFLIGALSSFVSPGIDADGNSVMAILNTVMWIEPEAHNAAIIFEENLPPVEGLINSYVGIPGTARIISGPQSTIQFEGYSLNYSSDTQNPVWQEIDGLHTTPVKNDTLAIWNTNGLTAGPYLLLLSMYHNLGDSIPIISNARLDDPIVGVDEGKSKIPASFAIYQNYPNPFNPNTKIKFNIPTYPQSPPYQGGEVKQGWFVQLNVYDILGNEIATLVNEIMQPGIYEIDFNATNLASGVYFCQLKAGSFRETKKMILLR